MPDKPAHCGEMVSPEYRKTCLELAIKHYADRKSPAKPETIVAAAKVFYRYVHEANG